MSDSITRWLIERTDAPGIYWSGWGFHDWGRNPDAAIGFSDPVSAERAIHNLLNDKDRGRCKAVKYRLTTNAAEPQQCSGQTIDGRTSHPVVETCGEPAPHSCFGLCMLAKGHQPAAIHEHACLSCVELETQIDRLAGVIINEIPGEPSQTEGAVDTAIRIIRKLRIEHVEFRDRDRLLSRAIERVRSILNTVGDTSDLLHRLTNL